MTQPSPTTLRARLLAVMSPSRWAWLLSVWLPLAGLLLVLKGLRIASLNREVSLSAAVELITSELFVVVALGVVGFGLFSRYRAGVSSTVAAGLYQTLALAFAAVNIVGHQFYMATGSGIDWHLVEFGLSHAGNVFDVVTSEVSWWAASLLGSSFVYFAAAPPLIARWWRKRTDDQLDPEQEASLKALVAALGAATVAILVALIPAETFDLGTDFTREPTLHVAATALYDTSYDMTAPGQVIFDADHIQLAPVADEERKNVVFVILESTRTDAVTPYNPDRETTPFLAELAEHSALFEETYAVVPHTSKALVALLCGIPPRPTMRIVEAAPGGIPTRCLPRLLGEHGYETAFFQNATQRFEHRDKLVEEMGFDDFFPLERLDTDGFEKSNYFGYEEAVLLPASRQWLERARSPFMATYLTLSPHHDYLAPRRYGRHAFDDDDTFNRYLNAVHYVDNFVRELIDQYKELGLYESTLFVIVADHGEAFGEHGRFQHDNVLYQEGVHVPFLIHDPQTIERGFRVSRRVGHLDIVPTVAQMLGFRLERARLPGMSVFRAPPDRPHFFSCWYQDRCIGSRFGPYKYIHHYGHQPDELFDLTDDPGEQKNLADQHPDLITEQRQLVLTWRALVEDAYDAALTDE